MTRSRSERKAGARKALKDYKQAVARRDELAAAEALRCAHAYAYDRISDHVRVHVYMLSYAVRCRRPKRILRCGFQLLLAAPHSLQGVVPPPKLRDP